MRWCWDRTTAERRGRTLAALPHRLRVWPCGWSTWDPSSCCPRETYYWNYSRHSTSGIWTILRWWPGRSGWARPYSASRHSESASARVCCGIVASFFAYRLTRNLFGEAAALRAVLLAQILPFFFLSAFLMTPDAPLTAAWAASLYFLERALVARRREAWWRAGAGLGTRLHLQVFDRFARRRDAALHGARSGRAPLVAALGAVCRRRAGARDLLARHHLERAARVGLLRIPNVAAALGGAAIRLAQADRLRPHSHHADRGGGGGDGAHARKIGRAVARMAVPQHGHSGSADGIRDLQSASRGQARLDRRPMDRRPAGDGAGDDRCRAVARTRTRLDTRRVDAHSGGSAVDLWRRPALSGAGTSGRGLRQAYRTGPVGWRDFSRKIADAAAQIRVQTGVEPLVVGMDRYRHRQRVGLLRSRGQVRHEYFQRPSFRGAWA